MAGLKLVVVLSCVVYGTGTVLQRVYLDTVSEEDARDEATVTNDDDDGTTSALTLNTVNDDSDDELEGSDHNAASQQSSLVEVPPAVHKLATNAIPWFGGGSTINDTWSSFTDGVRCIFQCNDSLVYGCLYAFGYIVTYAGEAQLNHFSPTLSSIVLQLSSPVTAILLLIVPAWNVDPGSGSWGWQVGGMVLLLIATALYNFWEKITRSASVDLPPVDEEEA